MPSAYPMVRPAGSGPGSTFSRVCPPRSSLTGKTRTFVRADVVDFQNIRMIQGRNGSATSSKRQPPIGVLDQRLRQHLYRDLAHEPHITRDNLTHLVCAERRLDNLEARSRLRTVIVQRFNPP